MIKKQQEDSFLIKGELIVTSAHIQFEWSEDSKEARLIMDIQVISAINGVKMEPYSIKSKHPLSNEEISKLIYKKVITYENTDKEV